MACSAPTTRSSRGRPSTALTWGKAMAWDLRGNMGDEIERAVLLKNADARTTRRTLPALPRRPSRHRQQDRRGDCRQRAASKPPAFDVSDSRLSHSTRSTTLRSWTRRLVPPATESAPTPGLSPVN
ncbi:MAG: hypothetical protein MZV63_06750 [Marinilabiliales bacterium]|nr:hypothetical protein [Marinilabiliales bacterium]